MFRRVALIGDWRQQWTISYQAWGGQYSREKNCLINWSHTRSTGEMSLKNSARFRVTEYGQNCLRGLEDSDGKETGKAEQGNPHRSWLPKPPSPIPANSMSHCCTPDSWLPGFDPPGNSHLMSGREFCLNLEGWVGIELVNPILTTLIDHGLSWFLPGNKLLPGEPAYHAGGNVKCTATLENRLFLVKPDIRLP